MSGFTPVNSKAAYRMIRIIHLRDDDLTPAEISDENLGQESAETILELFADSGLLARNKHGKTSYRLKTEFLVDTWADLWEEDVSQEFEPSGKREKFLRKWVQIYFREVNNSSVREMLVEDFFQGLREFTEREDFTPDWVRMWYMTLKQNYTSVQSPMEIFEEALDEIE